MSATRFLILGCHRSGTTLLRLILDSHSQVFCYDESQGYTAYETEHEPLAPVEGFKAPNYTELVLEYEGLYRGEPILFVLRDVRGVVASMRNLRTPRGTMLDSVKVSLDDWATDQRRTGFAKLVPEYEALKSQPYSDLRQAALFWRYKTEAYFELAERGYKVLPISYERLCRAPRRQLQKVADWLGLDWEDSLLKHHRQDHTETKPNGYTIGKTNAKVPIHRASLATWKVLLRQPEKRAILDVAGELNRRIHAITATG